MRAATKEEEDYTQQNPVRVRLLCTDSIASAVCIATTSWLLAECTSSFCQCTHDARAHSRVPPKHQTRKNIIYDFEKYMHQAKEIVIIKRSYECVCVRGECVMDVTIECMSIGVLCQSNMQRCGYTHLQSSLAHNTHTHTFAPIYNDWANATFMGLAINRDSQAKCILWNLALIYWYHSRSKNEHWATSERHRKKKTKTHSKDEVQFTIFPPSRPCAMCRLCLLGVRAVIYLSIIGVKNRQHGKILKKNVSVDSQRQRIMHIIYIHANCSICFICIGHERHRPDKSTLVRCV